MREEIFDRVANFYDDWYKTPLGKFADKVENSLIFKYLGYLKGLNLLDVGCGTGLYSLRACMAGAKVVGIDVSKKMLEIAKEKAKRLSLPINFIEGDMENLSFLNNSFDVVLSVTALEFSEDPVKAVKEFFRVLKPGGKVVIGVLSSQSKWAKKRRQEAQKTDSLYYYAHFFETRELKELLLFVGFKSIKIRTSLFISPNNETKVSRFANLTENFFSLFTPLNGAFIVGNGIK